MGKCIIIDGAKGEGGGQMLRSSLSLSMLTGNSFRMKNIRSRRAKPGLMRQHLTSIKAASEICNANVIGVGIGAKEIEFRPGEIRGGEYHFAIGTAGSTSLVAQTIIPALIFADKQSRIIIDGGTHNINAPTFDFINNSYLPIIRKMGVEIEAEIESYGFYPAGGGRIIIEIKPTNSLKSVNLIDLGNLKNIQADIIFANLPFNIPERELKLISHTLSDLGCVVNQKEIKKTNCSWNVISLNIIYDNITEVITSFGVVGVKAEQVAKNACTMVKDFIAGNFVVGEYLADQIILPMAISKGEFTTTEPSSHFATNCCVINKFIDCNIKELKYEKSIYNIKL